MNVQNFKDLLGLWLGELEGDGSIYMLGELTRGRSDMSNDDVHRLAEEYGGDVEVRRLYEKLRGELEMRVIGKMNAGILDKVTGNRMLECFFDWKKGGKEGRVEERVSRLGGKRDVEIYEEFVAKVRGIDGI